METLLIFFLAFRFIGILGGLYFSLRIAHIPVTPTRTWILFTLGWLAFLAQSVVGLFFVRPVQEILESSTSLTYASLIFGSLFVLFFFAATVRVYYDLKAKFNAIL